MFHLSAISGFASPIILGFPLFLPIQISKPIQESRIVLKVIFEAALMDMDSFNMLFTNLPNWAPFPPIASLDPSKAEVQKVGNDFFSMIHWCTGTEAWLFGLSFFFGLS